jgi:hypothetical protein
MASEGGGVVWRIVSGSSAEETADKAVDAIFADLAGYSVPGVAASGLWHEKRNRAMRPRVRGPWACVWLSSRSKWAYEAVVVKIGQLGRLRV